ncbi:hypothetical protein [Bifidobacterium longum]|uniref:Uncharacterized protein n=1 Tax=Bifidobacterium longum subsp. suis TaxID=1695 RepID=A0A087BFF8_BIFLN|nr:hypothetical protein [Bifidobacterium longum]KFI69758.1 hypothetical protein BLSS_0059 [Bifidobacterium longum subsp. suis]UNU71436.1 hypothetical protein LMY38_01960 [Bifidobacterium longum]SDO57766.1 hypothetical protein SAMN04489749_1497 [Bifidobacterium longum]
MKVSYSLNGQPLDSDRMRVLVGTTHYTALSPIVDTVQVPGRHGVIVGSSIPVLDAPELTVKVAAWGADSDALISRFRASCLHAAKLTIGKTETLDDGSSRSMSTRAVCTSCEPDDDERPFSDLRVMTAVFQLPDVFWHGVQWQEVTLAASGGRLLPGGVPDGWLSNAPITTLVLRFGAATGVTIADPVSGTNLMWGSQRDASRPYLFVDVANRKAWTAANADAWSGGTDTSNGVDWTTEPLQVWPAIDSCDYRLAIKQTGGTDKVTCRFLQSWE